MLTSPPSIHIYSPNLETTFRESYNYAGNCNLSLRPWRASLLGLHSYIGRLILVFQSFEPQKRYNHERLAGCPLLPAVATGHLIYDLSRTSQDAPKATLSMNAAFTVCASFPTVGFLLCAHALTVGQIRRLVFTTVALIPCTILTLSVFAMSGSKMPVSKTDHNLLPFLLFVSNLLRLSGWFLFSMRRVKFGKHVRLNWYHVLAMLMQWPMVLFYSSHDFGESSKLEGVFLPQTPYSIGDFDQAVAFSIGIVTLLLSLCDIVTNLKFSARDEFEYWRTRCVENIEYGDTDKEIRRWKKGVESIVKKLKMTRTRAKHREREQTTSAALPGYLKHAINARGDVIERRLRDWGFL